jgi:WD40 repeat protein
LSTTTISTRSHALVAMCLVISAAGSCKARRSDSDLAGDRSYLNRSTGPNFVTQVAAISDSNAFVRAAVNDPSLDLVYLADNTGGVTVINAATSAVVAQGRISQPEALTSIAVSGSATSRIIAVGDESGSVHSGMWQTTDPNFSLAKLEGSHKGSVAGVAVSAGNNMIASGGKDAEIRVWSLAQMYDASKVDYTTTLKPSDTDRRSQLAINAISILSDNSIVAARDSGVEHWSMFNMKDTPLFGFGTSKTGATTSRITAISSTRSEPTESCPKRHSIIAVGEENGKISVVVMPLGDSRYRPSKDSEAIRQSDQNIVRNNRDLDKIPGLAAAAFENMYLNRNRLNPQLAACLPTSPKKTTSTPTTIGNYQQDLDNARGVAWAIEPNSVQGHTGPVTSIVFANDARRMFSGSADGTIGLWDVAARSMVRKLVMPYARSGIAAIATTNMNDSAYFAVSGSPQLRRWDVALMNSPKKLIAGPTVSVASSEDGLLAAAGVADGKILLWETPASFDWKQELTSVAASEPKKIATSIEFLTKEAGAKLGEGTYLVSGHCDGSAYLWKREGNALKQEADLSITAAKAELAAALKVSPDDIASNDYCKDSMTARKAPTIVSVGSDLSGPLAFVFVPLNPTHALLTWDLSTKKPREIKPLPTAITPQAFGHADATLANQLPRLALSSTQQGYALLKKSPWTRSLTVSKSGNEALYGLRIYLSTANGYATLDEKGDKKLNLDGGTLAVDMLTGLDMMASGGQAGKIKITRLFEQETAAVYPHISAQQAAISPGPIYDLALRKDGTVLVASESSLSLIWANEAYTHDSLQ